MLRLARYDDSSMWARSRFVLVLQAAKRSDESDGVFTNHCIAGQIEMKRQLKLSGTNLSRNLPKLCAVMLAMTIGLVLGASLAAAEELCRIADSAIKSASEIRGLKIKEAVPCRVHNREQIKDYLLASIEEQLPPERLQAEELLFKSIGFIPKEFQYKEGIIQLYLSQIGGYYDPKLKRYVMAAWMPEVVQNQIAVHELTHALQDQYYDLKSFMDPKNMSTDQVLARAGLIEGDATAVMADYGRKLTGGGPLVRDDDVNALVLQNVAGTGLVAGSLGVPRTIVQQLVFPYSSGFRFVHARLRAGGYKSVDQAFLDPPRSTEEILHVGKYTANPREDIKTPGVAEIEADLGRSKLDVVHQDTLGEFVISVLLAFYIENQSEAVEAARGWGGDRIFIVRDRGGDKDGTDLVIWKSYWDTEQDAQEFYHAYQKVLAKLYPDKVPAKQDSTAKDLPEQSSKKTTYSIRLLSTQKAVLVTLSTTGLTSEGASN